MDRTKSSSMASLTALALGGSKVGSGSEMPTIANPRPLTRALLPREKRQPTATYQPVIGSSLAFIGTGGTTTPSERRGSVSTCYPLRPNIHQTPSPSSTLNRPKSSGVARATDFRNENRTESLPYRSGTNMSNGITSFSSRRPVVEDSIYPMLRQAFGKDDRELEEREIARLKLTTEHRSRHPSNSLTIRQDSEINKDSDSKKENEVFINQDDVISPTIIRSPRLIGLTRALALQDTARAASRTLNPGDLTTPGKDGRLYMNRPGSAPVKNDFKTQNKYATIGGYASSSARNEIQKYSNYKSADPNITYRTSNTSNKLEESKIENEAIPKTSNYTKYSTLENDDSEKLKNPEFNVETRRENTQFDDKMDAWYQPIPETPRNTIRTPRYTSTPKANDAPYSTFFNSFNSDEPTTSNPKELNKNSNDTYLNNTQDSTIDQTREKLSENSDEICRVESDFGSIGRYETVQHRAQESFNTDDSGIDRGSDHGLLGHERLLEVSELVVDDGLHHFSSVNSPVAVTSKSWDIKYSTNHTDEPDGAERDDWKTDTELRSVDSVTKVSSNDLSREVQVSPSVRLIDQLLKENDKSYESLTHNHSTVKTQERVNHSDSMTNNTEEKLLQKDLKANILNNLENTSNSTPRYSIRNQNINDKDSKKNPNNSSGSYDINNTIIHDSSQTIKTPRFTSSEDRLKSKRISNFTDGKLLAKSESIVEHGNTLEVELEKGKVGLGFCIEGGRGSVNGDRPIAVKRIFKGQIEVEQVLHPGDVILNVNGKDFTSLSQYEAWNYMKLLPEGRVQLTIRR